jgi:RNA polymerase sigma-70 factor (ECF subfamily)
MASYRRIVGQVFALLGDLHEAEDVTQDAFAKASFHWSRIAAYDQPEAWVRRVAFNEAYISTRQARRWLSPRHREVLVLHYVAELSVEEVAGQLRLPWAPSRAVSTVPGTRSPNSPATSARGSPMRDDLLKEQLMSYARTAAGAPAATTGASRPRPWPGSCWSSASGSASACAAATAPRRSTSHGPCRP